MPFDNPRAARRPGGFPRQDAISQSRDLSPVEIENAQLHLPPGGQGEENRCRRIERIGIILRQLKNRWHRRIADSDGSLQTSQTPPT